MSIGIATMGKFCGRTPRSWDLGSGGGPAEIQFVDKKLPTVRVTKVNKKEIHIEININNIKED